MAKKDKFAQLHAEGGGVKAIGSFNDQAKAVAAIALQEQPSAQPAVVSSSTSSSSSSSGSTGDVPVINPQEQPRFMRLPNPKIPLQEYNLVSNYCNSFANMTRQDFVELAIIEKLYSDGGMSQEDFNRRYEEIRNRPPRGQRKGTKQTSM